MSSEKIELKKQLSHEMRLSLGGDFNFATHEIKLLLGKCESPFLIRTVVCQLQFCLINLFTKSTQNDPKIDLKMARK